MRPRGGIIGANVALPASGIWTQREAEAYARAIPCAPSSVSGTAGGAQVSLTWIAPGYAGTSSITDYTVQYSSNSGSTWTTFSHAASTAASATVTGLTNGTAYIFRVAAVNASGNGPFATSGSVTPAVISFTPMAVLLTSGTSYAVPTGATTMKAWAVGSSGLSVVANAGFGAGGCAYKTWSVSGGSTVAYTVGTVPGGSAAGGNSTVTFGGVMITGGGGGGGQSASLYVNGGSFSGGDGGATGGAGEQTGSGEASGGAVGGNGTKQSCGRKIMTDVSGLLAAVALAAGKTTEDCGVAAAFGSGSASGKFRASRAAGYGGGGSSSGGTPGAGAVVLYFT